MPRRDDFDWNEAMNAELRRLWMQDAPQLSTSQIGAAMGLTKAAVVGRARRMKLPGRPSPIITRDGAAPRKASPRSGAAQVMAAHRSIPKPPPAPRREVAEAPAMLALGREYGCRWPLWGNDEAPTHRYCNAPRAGIGSYCLAHRAVAYARPLRAIAARAGAGYVRVAPEPEGPEPLDGAPAEMAEQIEAEA